MQTYHVPLVENARGCAIASSSSSSFSCNDPKASPRISRNKLRSRLKALGDVGVGGSGSCQWGCGCLRSASFSRRCRRLERRGVHARAAVSFLTPEGSPSQNVSALKSFPWRYSTDGVQSWLSGQSIAAIALGATLFATPLCGAVELQVQDAIASSIESFPSLEDDVGYPRESEDVHHSLEMKVASDLQAELAIQTVMDSDSSVDESPSMCLSCVLADSDMRLAVTSGPESPTLSAMTALAPVAAATSAATIAALSPGAANVAARVALSSSEAATVASGALATLQPPVASVAVPNLIARLSSSVASTVQHLVGGGFAGAVGATVVYPLDTVKTKMQAQGRKEDGEPEYKDLLDCFYQVVTKEGPGSLYSGLLPQLVGIAPEKAVKLTVNELLLSFLQAQLPGSSMWTLELLAGAGGGGSQVVFTNPVEIVKVRLQTQPSDSISRPKTAMEVVKELGWGGLYHGTLMCLARDVPSTALFFGAYAFLKPIFPGNTFLAGAIAAAPATLIVTPFDVIKTRLQMEVQPGQAPYKGSWDCMVRLVNEEGFAALFRGGLTRVLRVSPQFGITIMIYDLLS